MQNVLRTDIPHRFWTFSIPKRLRIYFKYRRKLMGLLVQAAKQTVMDALTQGQPHSHEKAGMIILIQTQGDELNFNCHLHALITDGLLDYRNPKQVIYHPCLHWDFAKLHEVFRYYLLRLMLKENVIQADVADNLLMSWPHSGFHVYASEAFIDEERLERCLRYSFRAPVTLDSLSYNDQSGQVQLTTKKEKCLEFKPKDFIAYLVQHIPDRYQNMRRYAGYYAANVRLRIQRAQDQSEPEKQESIEQGGPVNLSWSKLISKIFGEVPTLCPKCGDEMQLSGFVFDTSLLLRRIRGLSRAPPQLRIEKRNGAQVSILHEESQTELHFNQTQNTKECDYDQSQSW